MLLAIASNKYEQYRMSTIIATIDLASSCDLHTDSCSTALPVGGEVNLSLYPRPVPVIEKLTIDVKTKDQDVNKVIISFEGVDMNMGDLRFSLKQSSENTFQGNAVLPVCIRGSMQWIVNVLIHTKEGIIVAPFPLETKHQY